MQLQEVTNMNERITSHEVGSSEKLHLTELAQENLKRVQEAAEQAETPDASKIEHIQQQVEEQAISGHEYTVGEREAAPASHTFGAHKQLKADSYKRTLSHIQNKLSWPEKTFSKRIHGAQAEKLSSIGAQTIARPWGILIGGLAAFVGSLVVLVLASHYGFRYNFSLFIILFFGGYILGSCLELLGHLVHKKQH